MNSELMYFLQYLIVFKVFLVVKNASIFLTDKIAYALRLVYNSKNLWVSRKCQSEAAMLTQKYKKKTIDPL